MDPLERSQFAGGDLRSYWYYQSKYELLRKHLLSAGFSPTGLRCLDFGCGIGLILSIMETDGWADSSRTCGVDPTYADESRAYESAIKIFPHPGLTEGNFDFVLLMDVLEHVEKEETVLHQAVEQLRPGGHIFLTVPAHPFLWSPHDEYLGHHRRYTLPGLISLVSRIDQLEIKRAHYFFASVLPFAVVLRMWRRLAGWRQGSDLRPLPNILNSLLKWLSLRELNFCFSNQVCGLSAVLVAQKNAGSQPDAGGAHPDKEPSN